MIFLCYPESRHVLMAQGKGVWHGICKVERAVFYTELRSSMVGRSCDYSLRRKQHQQLVVPPVLSRQLLQ